LQIKGRLILDNGAVKVLTEQGKSLLAVGVKSVEGQFNRGDLVCCLDDEGFEIARGLVNYSAAECLKLAGKSSSEFEAIIGYADDEELIHRD
jgi:glutamate 5-kinase